MESFHQQMQEYKEQMQKGTISHAYKGLMEYLLALKTHLQNQHPDYSVSGSLYFGYMDMTYFSFFPNSWKERKLKAAIVFLHDTCRFEIWLAGVNKQVQSDYWKLFKEYKWDTYPLVPSLQGMDSIMESVLVLDPDFSDLDELTKKIECSTLRFIQDVESFLSQH